MFIKEVKTKNKKTGKEYVKHVLVESIRRGKQVKPRTILNLGRLDLPRELWPQLAEELSMRLSGQSELKLPGVRVRKEVKEAADRAIEKYYLRKESMRRRREAEAKEKEDVIETRLDEINSTEHRSIGTEYVCDYIWRELKIEKLLKGLGFRRKDIELSEALVLGRLINPGSELATWEWLKNRSGLAEITGMELSKIGRNRFYKTGDLLLKNKEAIESHLQKQAEGLNSGKETVYLFDLTNFYFRGQCLGNSLCFRGKSKEKRNDCPLVSLGLVVNGEGFPIYSKIFPGNIGEPSTLERILKEMGLLEEGILSGMGITLAMDRGIATRENIEFIKSYGFSYVLITRGAMNSEYLTEFENYQKDKDFFEIEKNGYKIYVKKVTRKDGITEVLCVSEQRKKKEEGIRLRWQERATDDLANLQRSVRTKRPGTVKDISKIHIRIGRLCERYPGFNKYFRYEIIEDKERPGRAVDIKYEPVPVFDIDNEESDPLSGSYVIETTHSNKTAEEIWELYMTLNKVEKAFKSMKSDLGTRPVFHQTAERTEAHLFISVIAYHILCHIEWRLKQNLEGFYRYQPR